MKQFKLCYIDAAFAWFTTAELSEQWGDDWDDAPYDCNAGKPYAKDGVQLMKIAYESNLVTPAEISNSIMRSVKQINSGEIPWLRDYWGDSGDTVMAGASPEEFTQAVLRHGGMVYLPLVQDEVLG
jgi:hypothetical protein